jgi:hypothetical protein
MHRHLVRVALLLSLFSSRAAIAEGPSRVAYFVEEAAGSWQPLDPGDVAKTIEQAALEVLTKPGLMKLERQPQKTIVDAKSDYVLTIRGRMLDEAQTHSVYLTFEPGKRTDLASFRASDTAELGKQTRAAMLTLVEASARKAAAQLIAVLGPQLASANKGTPGDAREESDEAPSGQRTLPWKWAEVHVPQPSSLAAASALYSKKQGERMAALRELTSLALTEASPRNALERCALGHEDHEMRLGCLVALRPQSRRTAPTERVVIEVFRKDKDGNVVEEASDQMSFFVGLSRSEAAQAWLERASRCDVRGPIDRLGDVPNLDLAIRSCLYACGKKEKYQRSKRSCIEMLKPVPHERRRRILWRFINESSPDSPYYVEGAGASEGSTGTDWQWAVEAILEDATTWDPKLEDILWSRYQRTLSSFSIDVLGEAAPASQRLMDRLVELVQTAGARQGLQGLRRIAREDPALRPAIREKLSELLATSSYPKSIHPQDLESAVKELEKP